MNTVLERKRGPEGVFPCNKCTKPSSVQDSLDRIYYLLVSMVKHVEAAVKNAANAFNGYKNLERIADLSTNIAEQTIFNLDKQVIKHTAKPLP